MYVQCCVISHSGDHYRVPKYSLYQRKLQGTRNTVYNTEQILAVRYTVASVQPGCTLINVQNGDNAQVRNSHVQ
jgi:hypothetical protein